MTRQSVLCFILILLYVASCLGQSGGKEIEVPQELLNQLKIDDKDVREMLRDGYDPDVESEKVFCDLVDLNSDQKPEYVLSQLGGNSSGPIWIYRKTSNGYQQILSAGSMGYSVLKTSTNGYHDLRMSYGGTSGGYNSDIYKFNGRKYVLRSSKHKKGIHGY